MELTALCSAENTNVMVEPYAPAEHTLIIFGAVRPGRVRWVGSWIPGLPLRWRDSWRAMRPKRVRWVWALLLAVAIVLLMGEFGPAASAIALLR